MNDDREPIEGGVYIPVGPEWERCGLRRDEIDTFRNIAAWWHVTIPEPKRKRRRWWSR